MKLEEIICFEPSCKKKAKKIYKHKIDNQIFGHCKDHGGEIFEAMVALGIHRRGKVYKISNP